MRQGGGDIQRIPSESVGGQTIGVGLVHGQDTVLQKKEKVTEIATKNTEFAELVTGHRFGQHPHPHPSSFSSPPPVPPFILPRT